MNGHSARCFTICLSAALILLSCPPPAGAAEGLNSTPPGPVVGGTAGDAFVGLQPGLGSLPLLGRGRTRSISAENPTGERGKGGMAIPNPGEPKPVASARAADDLGQGWKVRPFIRINAGETATLTDGSAASRPRPAARTS